MLFFPIPIWILEIKSGFCQRQFFLTSGFFNKNVLQKTLF